MMMYYLVFSGQVGRLHRISTDLYKYDAVLTANTRHSPECFNVGPTTAKLANIETASVECLVWPCVCWAVSLR